MASQAEGGERRPRDLSGLDLSGQDLRESHLSGARLDGTRLAGANLHGVDLRGASLRDAVLDGADLRDAVADGATFHAASLVATRANGARFERADFTLASLRRADLTFADLAEARLTDADLGESRLERAILRDADLTGAELGGAMLRGAVLSGANLREAHLDGADFAGARFAFTVVAASDLSRAVGLDSVVHEGPSTVGIDAFLLSRGEIPDAFLTGIGLSPLASEYLKAVAAAEEGMLVGDALFLLFADADRPRARRLRAYLRLHHRPCWYWQERQGLAGDRNPDLKLRIRFHDRLVVLGSSAGARDGALDGPIAAALAQEARESRRIVTAVRLEAASPAAPGALARVPADRWAADFSGADWQDPRDAVFARELARLEAALEARGR